MHFTKHTSPRMVSLFNEKPYQGQNPHAAKIIFLSSDANYSPEISDHEFFKYILEYQADGIDFWKKYDVHHPFLLPNYPFDRTRAGVPFHRNFSKIGLTKNHAEHISFVELLDVPTIGNKSRDKQLFWQLVSTDHLAFIDELLLSEKQKVVFVPGGILKDMLKLKRDYGVFDWLDYEPQKNTKYSMQINGTTIYETYHFSASQIHGEINKLRKVIDAFLNF